MTRINAIQRDKDNKQLKRYLRLYTRNNLEGGGGSSVQDVTIGGSSVVVEGVAVIPEIPNVPGISTNIFSDKASNTKTASPKAVYNEIHPGNQSSQPSNGMKPNILYVLGEISGNYQFLFAPEPDASVINHWYFMFDTGSTAPTITWPNVITKWIGGTVPTINANKHYEVSVLKGVAICKEV